MTDGAAADGALGRLYAAQRRRRERWLLLAVAAVLGLALSAVHWSGLFVGGALVGLSQPSLRRALVAGLVFGIVVLTVAAVQFAAAGVLDRTIATGQVASLGVAIAVGAPLLGAAARGLVPDAPVGAGERRPS